MKLFVSFLFSTFLSTISSVLFFASLTEVSEVIFSEAFSSTFGVTTFSSTWILALSCAFSGFSSFFLPIPNNSLTVSGFVGLSL